MANRERGEMTLVAGAQSFTLRLTTNTCCELEERSGKSFEEQLALWNTQRRATAFRWLVWAALQDQHADVAKTPADVGPIIDACDEAELVRLMASFITLNTEHLKDLIREGILKAPATGAPAADPRRRARVARAGTSSTSKPAAGA